MATEIPLLTNSQNIYGSKDHVTMEDVKRNHENLLNNEQSLENKMVKTIDILGGIDAVFSTLLTNPKIISLTKDQLYQLNEVILSINSEDSDERGPILIVAKSNTFLHHICNENISFKIIDIMFNKTATVILAITSIILIIINSLYKSLGIFFYIIQWSIFSLFIPYLILVLLSLSITTTKQIMMSFEFWVKTYYLLRFWIFASLFWWYHNTPNTSTIVWRILEALALFMYIWVYCLMDGLQASFRFKAIVWTFTSIFMLFIAFTWIVDEWNGVETPMQITLFNKIFHIEPHSLATSSIRTVVLFMWKKTIYSIYKSDKATSIKRSVQINW
eukprot:550160_1